MRRVLVCLICALLSCSGLGLTQAATSDQETSGPYERGLALKAQGDLRGAMAAFEEYLGQDSETDRAQRARYYVWLIRSWQVQDERWRECGRAFAEIGDIAGAVFDPATGWPILFGRKEVGEDALPPPALEDLLTAFTVVRNGEVPGVSIEPAGGINPSAPVVYTSPPSTFSVRYLPGWLKDTHLGYLLFEADRTLKPLCLGRDNLTRKEFTSSVPGYQSIPKRMGPLAPLASGFFAAPIFTPRMVELRRAGNAVRFGRIVMGVDSQSQQAAAEQFVRHLEDSFDLFSKELVSLQELVRAAKFVAIARWLQDRDVNMSYSKYTPAGLAAPTETPTVTAEVSRKTTRSSTGYVIEIAMLCGGVLLATPNTYVADATLSDLAKAVLSARPRKTAIGWDFTVGGVTHRAVAIPLGGRT